jgi:methionyl aminopeptidase
VNNTQIPEQYFRAGRIANEMKPWVKSRVAPGVEYRAICRGVEEEIVRRDGEPAFPCGIGVNHVSAHYAPQDDDTGVIREDDLVKLDYGVHVDGYIADTAVTVTFNSRYQTLLEATERALHSAIDTVRKDRRIGEIGRAIWREATRDGFKTINNLSGHTLERYIVHAGKSIPNLFVPNLPVLKKGEVFAIEPFLTLGDAAGYVVEAPQETIYSLIGRKRTGTRDADELLEKIWSMRKTLPFTPRWFARDYPGEKMRQLLSELKRKKLVRGYGTLVEASSRPVAQFEHTVALDDDTMTVLT